MPHAVHNPCSCQGTGRWTGARALVQMACVDLRLERRSWFVKGARLRPRRGMANFVWYIVVSASMAVIAVGGVWYLRAYLNGTPPRISFFGPRPEPRLAVVDHANVDGRRRLVLVRRDNTEHLIMTGGPVDVVIETGIPVRHEAVSSEIIPAAPPVLSVQPVFSRAPRTIGTAAAGTTEGAAG